MYIIAIACGTFCDPGTVLSLSDASAHKVQGMPDLQVISRCMTSSFPVHRTQHKATKYAKKDTVGERNGNFSPGADLEE